MMDLKDRGVPEHKIIRAVLGEIYSLSERVQPVEVEG
jgi:hypothetical protein